MLYRNSLLANGITWLVDGTPGAVETALNFLRAECQILRLSDAAETIVSEIEDFLRSSANLPINVYRSTSGELLIRAESARDDVLVTGRTAEVLSAYIRREVVRTQDRLDMTLRQESGVRDSSL